MFLEPFLCHCACIVRHHWCYHGLRYWMLVCSRDRGKTLVLEEFRDGDERDKFGMFQKSSEVKCQRWWREPCVPRTRLYVLWCYWRCERHCMLQNCCKTSVSCSISQCLVINRWDACGTFCLPCSKKELLQPVQFCLILWESQVKNISSFPLTQVGLPTSLKNSQCQSQPSTPAHLCGPKIRTKAPVRLVSPETLSIPTVYDSWYTGSYV